MCSSDLNRCLFSDPHKTHKYSVWAERGISFYYIRPTNAQYIVYLLDEYNKIYTMHGTFYNKMLDFLVGELCGKYSNHGTFEG